MKILIVAATQGEIEPLFLDGNSTPVGGVSTSIDDPGAGGSPQDQELKVLITGVGMVATAFSLGRHLAINQYDLAINLGIAGSFERDLDLGEVVEVTSDTFSEFGAEDGEAFLSIKDLGFGENIFTPSTTISSIFRDIPQEENNLLLKQVTGITVNCVHGSDSTISKLKDRISPGVESMEGAAFFYACKQAGVPCVQIRAVSNYVEKRNREAWQIGLAVKNLNTFASVLLNKLDLLT